jgi:DNA-binding CsgD family transcriptional regulator
MTERFTPKGAAKPGRVIPATGWFSRLLGWVQGLFRSRIWIILPGKQPKPDRPLLLPVNLVGLLHRQAQELDKPPEALLLELLQTALLEHRQPDPIELAWRSLSERERQVACLMVAGLSNREIAARLMISRNTVRSHARGVVRKFGCANRKELPDLWVYCQQTR